MTLVKLLALDESDLQVISAHVQDAVSHVRDLAFRPAEHRFALALNRFVWEKKATLRDPVPERRNAVLHFDRVMSVRTSGIDRSSSDTVLSLLALRFAAGAAPAGAIELVFSGEATIRLDVECIEAALTDLGAAWQASSRPSHSV